MLLPYILFILPYMFINIYIFIYLFIVNYITRWCPPNYKLVYNPNNYRYNPLINPSEIVLINQLNANELGHHLVPL